MGDDPGDGEQAGVGSVLGHSGGELTVQSRQRDWDPADDADLHYALRVIDGDVPAEGWMALAQEFLRRLGC